MADTDYDPWLERDIPTATSDLDTLAHMLRAIIGTGILALPIAFMYSGLGLGIFSALLANFICTHCSYILVQCAHSFYYRLRVSRLSFADLAEISFLNGPECSRFFAPAARYCVIYGLFITYFGICSVYTVIVAASVGQVIEYYYGSAPNIRLMIAAQLIPLILLVWIPNLKSLAIVSIISMLFTVVALAITLFYIFQDLPPIETREYFILAGMPPFMAIAIFAMQAIGVVMVLENNMRTPTHYIGLCGIMVWSNIITVASCILLGFFGYLRFGNKTAQSITLNLPLEEWGAQAVQLLISVGVFCTFGVQFQVCLQIMWDSIKEKCTERPLFWNYVTRTVLCILMVLLAILVPTIAPFMGLLGAFFFTMCGIIFPLIIELLTYWEIGFGFCYWMVWKDIFIGIIGGMALVFGSIDAIKNIAKQYSDEPDF